jgi:hypothetical protein
MKRVFVPVFILFFLLSVKADCYSGFIPKMRLSHSNSKECLYNPLIHINSEDRVAIDYLETVTENLKILSLYFPGDFTIQ